MLKTPFIKYTKKRIFQITVIFSFISKTEDQNAILVASFSLGLLGLLVTLLVSIALAYWSLKKACRNLIGPMGAAV
jgi:hypothetical protein